MSIDWYRRIFVTDMANRTLNTDYNIYSNEEWLEGWNQMLVPGAYERGIFGDLMLPGIACGLRKFILIFNTNPDTPHDPIYVVDPSNFNVAADSEIPVVLAYNMSHYESMEPCSDADMKATIDLVRTYKDGRYRYTRQDISRLISLQTVNENLTSRAQTIEEADGQDATYRHIGEGNTDINGERTGSKSFDKLGKKEEVNFEDQGQDNLYFKYKRKSKEIMIEQMQGKMKCPICKAMVKNVSLHFQRKLECG